jgi:hypothetical protein
MNALGKTLLKIPKGRYRLIIVDAFYRTLPSGVDENDNAGMAGLYNSLDGFAERTGAAFELVHHSSKGNQAGKSVVDVGSGAGSQSRATDTHLILRHHEQDNVVVLEAAVRSWPPVKPCCLRWTFPVWRPEPDLDPADLRSEKPRRRRSESSEPAKPAEPPWTAERFAKAVGREEPRTKAALLEDALSIFNLSDQRAKDLFRRAVDLGHLVNWKEGGTWMVSTVLPPVAGSEKQRTK